MPTRALPRRWTLKEEEWYVNHWSYDGSTRDKVCSGEYVMERPPKKPGGTVRICLFLLSIFMAMGSAEGALMKVDGAHGGQQAEEFDDYAILESSANADEADPSSEGRTCKLFWGALLGMIFLLFLSFRKKLSKLWEEWSIVMEIMDPVDMSLENS